MFFLTSSILALVSLTKAQVSGSSTNSSDILTNVTMAFTQAQIVPEVIPSFHPKVATQPIFVDSVTTEEIDVVPGILLDEEQTHDPPEWFLASNTNDLSQSNVSWVIAIVDPDALTPQNPNVSQFLHFIGKDFVVNHSPVSTSGGLLNSTALMNTSEALVEFFPPSPPATSDPHRYVCLVFVQPDGFADAGLAYFNGSIPTNTTRFREFFNVTDFAANTTLGNPVAGNFFYVGANISNTSTSTSTMLPDTSAFPTPFSTPVLSTSIVEVTSAPATTATDVASPDTTTTSGAEKMVYQVPFAGLLFLTVVLGVVI